MRGKLLVEVELEHTHDDVNGALGDPKVVADLACLVNKFLVSVNSGKVGPENMV